MRKFFLGFAALPLLALLATSCSKETIESKNDFDRVLTFKATTGKQTLSKASEYSLADIQTDGVTVYSYNAANGNPYREFNLAYSGGQWTYTPVVFHPTTFALNHYSVYSSTGLADYQGGTEFTYIVADDCEDQEDLMIASTSTTSNSEAEATATLTYKHILSQVNFAIQGKEHLIVEISDIQLVGIKNSGTFTFGDIGDGGLWDLEDGIMSYDYVPAIPAATDGTNAILYLGNEGGSGNNSNTNALMLMPQSFTAGDGAGFTFNYILKNSDLGDEFDSGSATVNFSDLVPGGGEGWNGEWVQGKRYLYKIVFDPILLQFNVDVDEWEDYDGSGGLINVNTNN